VKTGKILAVIPILLNANATAQTRYSGTRTISTQQTGPAAYRLRDYSRGGGIETYNARNSTTLTQTMSHATDITNNSTHWVLNAVNKSNGALDAHWGSMMTYDYFLNVHGRNSYDNNGGVLRSYVHVGTNWDNAAWSRNFRFAYYGDGGARFDIFTSLDWIAHEIGHGITQFTANLVYSGESGAINESFSDIWAACVQNYADPNKNIWLIGNENGYSLPARSMSNPHLSLWPQPDTYGGGPHWTGPNAGVHHNSGIMNHWFYMLSVGKSGTNGIGNAYNVTGIGISKAEKITYKALTEHMRQSTTFADARAHTIRAAIDLYGDCTPEVVSVTNAWYAVGVGNQFVSTHVNLTNQIITTNTTVTTCGNINVQNTTVTPTGTLKLKATDRIDIGPGFTVEQGGSLIIGSP
jgi:Zn-dependent metalloprotease